MALTDLVTRLRWLRKTDPRFRGLKLRASARLTLKLEFGVEPTAEEVVELALEAKQARRTSADFFDDGEFEEDTEQERQTGGGRRVVRKSEPLAG